MFKIYDENMKIIECEVLSMFNRNGKDFILFIDDETNILAAYYRKDNDKIIISPIGDEMDFDIVDKELGRKKLC